MASASKPDQQPHKWYDDDLYTRIMRNRLASDQAAGGWSFMQKVKSFDAYRRKPEDTDLYEYKANGSMEGHADKLYSTFSDFDYQQHWNEFCKGAQRLPDGRLYFALKFPFPLSDREYFFARQVVETTVDGKRFYLMVSEARPLDSDPAPNKNKVRVVKFVQHAVISETDDPDSVHVWMEYFEDPGGIIPAWVINWAAKTALPRFIDNIKRAAARYPEFQKSQQDNPDYQGAYPTLSGTWDPEKQVMIIEGVEAEQPSCPRQQRSAEQESSSDRAQKLCHKSDRLLSDRGFPMVYV